VQSLGDFGRAKYPPATPKVLLNGRQHLESHRDLRKLSGVLRDFLTILGGLSIRAALSWSAALYAASLSVAFAIGTAELVLFGLAAFALPNEALRLVGQCNRRDPPRVLLKVAGWSVTKSALIPEAWLLGGIFGLFLLGATTTKDFADLEGDRANFQRPDQQSQRLRVAIIPARAPFHSARVLHSVCRHHLEHVTALKSPASCQHHERDTQSVCRCCRLPCDFLFAIVQHDDERAVDHSEHDRHSPSSTRAVRKW